MLLTRSLMSIECRDLNATFRSLGWRKTLLLRWSCIVFDAKPRIDAISPLTMVTNMLWHIHYCLSHQILKNIIKTKTVPVKDDAYLEEHSS
jgi:hypothetical protein